MPSYRVDGKRYKTEDTWLLGAQIKGRLPYYDPKGVLITQKNIIVGDGYYAMVDGEEFFSLPPHGFTDRPLP